MKININGSQIPYNPDLVWDHLNNLTKAIRPCFIYDILEKAVNSLIFAQTYKYDVVYDLSWINIDLCELAAVEVWL